MDPTNSPPPSQLAYVLAGVESPAARLRRQQQQSVMANLWQSGTSTAPVQSSWEGLNRMAQAALGGWMMNRAGLGAPQRTPQGPQPGAAPLPGDRGWLW